VRSYHTKWGAAMTLGERLSLLEIVEKKVKFRKIKNSS
jgi:hypothetical protein